MNRQKLCFSLLAALLTTGLAVSHVTAENKVVVIPLGSSSSSLWSEGSNDDIFRLNGNVGIGKNTSGTRLDVNGVITATGGTSTNWNTAYSWGNHTVPNYLTTEGDPVYGAAPAHLITTGQISNWNTAYGWGDHSNASPSYLTMESDPLFSTSGASGISAQDTINWDIAYGWGDHAIKGYKQNLFETVTGNSGSTTANSQTDTLTIAGSGGISTSVSGDTVTIDGSNTGDNLGNHIAVQGLDLATNRLVGEGGTEGIYIYNNGIVDLTKQSRVRAFLSLHPQLIPFSTWTIIEFDTTVPLPSGYDEHNEFFINPPNTFQFIPTTAGYYQINARTAFDWTEPGEPNTNSDGYVSIAIFVNDSIYAQGNNLQMVKMITFPPAGEALLQLQKNNAPNVSDVVYLQPGDFVEIKAWQSIDASSTNVPLVQGQAKTYVSIHKSS